MKKRTTKEIKNIIEKLGYLFIKHHCDDNIHQKVIIKDKNGYKYDVYIQDVINGKKEFRIIHVGNPFSLDNISLWLKLNNKEYTLLECEKYIGNNSTNLTLHHKKCNEKFKTSWGAIKSGGGCAVCRGLQVGVKNSLGHLRPDLIEEWSYYNKVSPFEITLNSHKGVYWICPVCSYGSENEWISSPNTRIKRNCPACSGRVVTDKNRLSILYPEIAVEWHPAKNGELTPDDISYGSGSKVWWLCPNGHEYFSVINSRTQGKGCKKCNKSNGEEKIRGVLDLYKIQDIEEQHLFPQCRNILPLPFDFYLPYYNLCIEFHGIQHYEEIKFFSKSGGLTGLQTRDKIKENYCKDNNINLLIIPYWEFDNIEKILINTLNEIKEGSN